MKINTLIYYAFLCMVLCGTRTARAQLITTVAGSGSPGYTGDGGLAKLAAIGEPQGVAVDGAGNMYITDVINHCVRKVNTAGIITTLAGTGLPGNTGDGGPATAATFYRPKDVACDAAGNVYVVDGNDRVRKITVSTGIITNFAGSGSGYGGDGTPATSSTVKLNAPYGIAFDKDDNLYIADFANDRIRKVTAATGIISTAASIGRPGDLVVDDAGNLYVTRISGNNIFKIGAGSVMTLIAGSLASTAGFSGDGSFATVALLTGPYGIARDDAGNIYFSDCSNNRVRKVDASGIITTIAGDGLLSFLDNVLATTGEVAAPTTMVLDGKRNLCVSDNNNHRVRSIQLFDRYPYFAKGPVKNFAVCQNSVGVSINYLLAAYDTLVSATENWSVVTAPAHGTLAAAYAAAATGGMITPAGLSYTPTWGYTGADAFRVKVTNGIKSDTILINVQVSSSSATPITGAASVCQGATTSFSHATVGGTWNSGSTGVATISGAGVVTGVSAGSATITYNAMSGSCAAAAVKSITVNPLPDAGAISGALEVCEGQTITMSNTVAGGLWSTSNGNATITVGGVVTGVTSGAVAISYVVTNSCGSVTAPLVNITVKQASACETYAPDLPMDAAGFKIQNNPVRDELIVLADVVPFNSFVIRNQLGQVVKEQSIIGAKTILDVKGLPSGMYYVSGIDATGIITKRFLKL